MGFKSVGSNVLIGRFAVIINAPLIELSDNVRIDDFCTVVAGSELITVGRNVHIGSHSHLAGAGGLTLGDFSGLSQGVKIYTVSDDYSGLSLTNPTVPIKYKSVTAAPMQIGRHAIVGSNSVLLPGSGMGEGAALGALSMLTKPADPWSVYFGSPAKKIKSRKRKVIELEELYLQEE